MSRAAKATFIGSVIFAGLTIWGVHFLQDWERDRMYQGVVRDEERRKHKQQQQMQAGYEGNSLPLRTPQNLPSSGGGNDNLHSTNAVTPPQTNGET